ncbi:MAG: threonine synthase [Acidimicrobiia bacterium]
MRYISTRGGADPVSFTQALVSGPAPDGGLYQPETIPGLPDGWQSWSYQEAVAGSLELYGASDPRAAVERAAGRFHHSEIAPLVEVGDRVVLELFWGPTLSFKDHALQVLAGLLEREVNEGTALGATSGDTGSAAIEAFRGIPGLRVVMLYPEGMVSDFQRRQMTTVPDANVIAVAVRGTFDDCQALVKQAFQDHLGLLAVNSINWARIAAQTGYYLDAAARIGEPFDVSVPVGNFGNAYSCWLAKQMGAPITKITLANNANRALFDLVSKGTVTEAAVVPTIAPAMDIRVPSNLERLDAGLTDAFEAGWSSDEEISSTIAAVEATHGYRLDPHTATAWRAGGETLSDRPQMVVGTAHPAKFDETVSPPEWFPPLQDMEERIVVIDPEPSALAPLIR